MRATFAIAVSTAIIGQVVAQNAIAVTDNPVGRTYKATLPDEPFFKDANIEGNVKGYISAVAHDKGEGVQLQVKFENLPKEGGPFLYHIHVDPSANCTKTLAHLDPFERGEATPCDSSAPETCQVGDLSGKHGKITSDPFAAEYLDEWASTKEGLGSFFGNRSFVIHYANKTRLTCANFEEVGTYNMPNGTGLPTPGPSGGIAPTQSGGVPSESGLPVVNAVSAQTLSLPLMLAGLGAAVFAL